MIDDLIEQYCNWRVATYTIILKSILDLNCNDK